MTKYEQIMYERDLPGIRRSLESIAETLKEIKVIISDPGDEVEHIVDYRAEMSKVWNDETSNASGKLPDNYVIDMD
jgi:hypothetical protein